jgi:hypothetical protein
MPKLSNPLNRKRREKKEADDNNKETPTCEIRKSSSK